MNLEYIRVPPTSVIACDVDDTLLGYPGDVPNWDLALWLEDRQNEGHTVLVWLWAGEDRAAYAARRFGLQVPVYDKGWYRHLSNLPGPDIAFDDRRPFPEDYGPPVWPAHLYLVGYNFTTEQFNFRGRLDRPSCLLCHDTGQPFINKISARVGTRYPSPCQCRYPRKEEIST